MQNYRKTFNINYWLRLIFGAVLWNFTKRMNYFSWNRSRWVKKSVNLTLVNVNLLFVTKFTYNNNIHMWNRFYTHAHTFHLLWVRKNLVYILGGTINPNYKKNCLKYQIKFPSLSRNADHVTHLYFFIGKIYFSM